MPFQLNARISMLLVVQTALAALLLPASCFEVAAAPPAQGPTTRTLKPGRPRGNSATQPADEQDADVDEPSEDSEVQIRLNYLKAPWAKVLKDLAEASQTEVVAERVPRQKYSRIDRKNYSLKDALRILNQTLEPQGYRLRQMGRYLVLMEVRTTRQEYARNVVSERAGAERPARTEHSTEVGGTADDETNEEPALLPAGNPGLRLPSGNAKPNPSIVPLSGEREAAKETARKADADTTTSEAPAAEQMTTASLRLKARDAVSVARILINAFKPQAELVDNGPDDLPGFVVFRSGRKRGEKDAVAKGDVRFAVGIDKEQNRLVVEASPAETKTLQRLIRSLDVLPKTEDSAVRALAVTKDAGQVAAALQPELDRLTEAAAEAQAERQANQPNQEGQPADPAKKNKAVPKKDAAEEPAADDQAIPPQGGIGSLKGEVSVEAVPELGILIIRGNEKDVDAVASVIREIERLSAGAALKVELLLLKHVNSEALAALLTTVYERLSGRARGPATAQSVSVIPIARPNAILILASTAEIESIKDLAKQLDEPADPAMEFKVFRLRHAIPSQVVTAVTAMYPAQQPGQAAQQQTLLGLSPRVRILPDVRTNSVIVLARPRDMKEVGQVIHKLDMADSAAVSQLKIIPLKNAIADEIAATLQLAIQSVLSPPRQQAGAQGGLQGGGGGGGGAQGGQGQVSPELREVKSTILQFLEAGEPQENAARSGILSDIRITADLRTNSLVITAPQESMPLLVRLVERLDKPAAMVSEIKVFSLRNGDATSTAQLLERLFSPQAAGQRGGQGGGLGAAGQLQAGIQIAGAEDASSTLIPLRFTVDVRTNSIIVVGGGEALRVVEAIVLRLDESDIRQRQNQVYRLINSPAEDVAAAISEFLRTQLQVQQTDPGLLSPFEQIEREVIVVPERVSNSLLISATPRFFKDVMELVTRLDQAPKQVVIQALLVEVSLDNTDEFGVELGLQDSILFNRSLISQLVQVQTTNTSPNGVQTTTNNVVSQTSNPGYLFNNAILGNNTLSAVNPSTVGTQGLTNFSVGRVNNDLGYGGLVLAAGSESVNVLLRALSARRRVDVLSRPQITTIDNQLAQIQVGQEIPRINGFNINANTGNATPIVQPRSVGIILTVTPRISPEGKVVMEVVARKDALNPVGVPLFTNPNGSVITAPIIDTTNALATVSIRSGQTIVLGGMITKTDDKQERKVPYLSDIPLVGELFRYDLKRTRKTELLIFLTPRIVHNEAEAELVKEIESQRMSYIEEEAEAIHGPLFGVPEEPEWIGPAQPGIPGYSTDPNLPAPLTGALSRKRSGIGLDELDTPTTVMPAEPVPLPPLQEGPSLGAVPSRKRNTSRVGAVR